MEDSSPRCDGESGALAREGQCSGEAQACRMFDSNATRQHGQLCYILSFTVDVLTKPESLNNQHGQLELNEVASVTEV